MGKFNAMIEKLNFKKIAIAYIFIVTAVAVISAIAAGVIFKDRISFALQYSKLSEAAEKNTSRDLQTDINKLAASTDVVDVLMLDASNKVTYSAKNSEFSKDSFDLKKTEEHSEYLINGKNNNAVFRYVKGDEFMLASVFNMDFGGIKDEYREENFFERDFSNKTVYMLSFIGEKNGGKIYVISKPTSVAAGAVTLKAVALAAVICFMLYWVLLALWTYQNALKSKLYPLLWGIIVLFTNIAGVIVYLIYKKGNLTCTQCGASQNRLHRFCTNCGAKLGLTCKGCGAPMSQKDTYCPNCGRKAE